VVAPFFMLCSFKANFTLFNIDFFESKYLQLIYAEKAKQIKNQRDEERSERFLVM
jgi:hypothetical protein